MNDFEPKFIRSALEYLSQKLKEETKDKGPKAYVVEKKKESGFRRFINSFFRS